jgi:hypothetical protein
MAHPGTQAKDSSRRRAEFFRVLPRKTTGAADATRHIFLLNIWRAEEKFDAM